MMTLLLGTSEIDITPEVPVSLAGFAHREGKATEVHSPLFLKTYYFEKDKDAFLLLIGDVIWWDNQWVKTWRRRITEEYSIKPESICFHATHNHSGPQTSDSFTSLLGIPEQSFIDSLEEKIGTCIKSAINNKEPVTVTRSRTKSDIGIYRRVLHENKIKMGPNPSIPINNDVTIITFETRTQKKKGMLIYFPCHPTTTDANVVSAEYTGVCCSIVKRKYPQAVIGFLQGCCGDIRPALIKDNEFYRGTLLDMEKVGEKLAQDIISASSDCDIDTILCDKIGVSSFQLPLRFQEEYTPNEGIESDVLQIWREHKELYWKEKKETFLEIQYMEVGHSLRFVFFNGEMVQEYAEHIQNIDSNTIVLGYSNGMIGYIPTQKQLMEGGYEAEDFIYYFGLPAPFHIETENTIQRAVENILRG
ncbi:neutral/alkaline non-lysosomal ceramidase N-terminal domain-containing protein [Ferdinandcohnia sp. Marseille-Q9671]